MKKEEIKNLIEKNEDIYFDFKPSFQHNEEYLDLKEKVLDGSIRYDEFFIKSDDLYKSIPRGIAKKQEGTSSFIEKKLDIKENYKGK